MIDYKDVWVKWMTFLNMDLKFRKEFLESLNLEVMKGFDVVAQIATEEVEIDFSDKKTFNDIKLELGAIFSHSVWAGYALFLVFEGIDPEKENLIANTATGELGNIWMDSHEKDKGKSYISKIDPFLSMFIEKNTALLINQLFLQYPTIQKSPYSQVAGIEIFSNWAAHQGYIFGMIEKELNSKK